MPDDPRVQQLLDALLETHVKLEEVCGPCPELLPQVRARWLEMCHAQAVFDALLPPMLSTGQDTPASPPEATPLPVIPGYQVEAVLGVGGMGVVFRARHLRLNRLVALKMTLAGAYAGLQERERFQREAEAVAALRHPNIVQIHDIGDTDGRPYFTMEYVEGGSLTQQLAGTPQPAREAAALLTTLTKAVHAAHQGGIIHRDLKPANVLLTDDGTPKISDFGLARRLDGEAGLTRTGTALGTPSYMAPEQAQGRSHAVGPATDIYALGAILYELLTGRPPFRAESVAETISQVLSQEPVPPSRLNRKVPRDLETICLKCLRKEPKLRYANAAALADDLERFQRGEAISARPEGFVTRLVRQVRRRPALAAAVVVSTLLALTLVGGGFWFLFDREATVRAAEGDLRDMAQHLRDSAWREAGAARDRAKGRLDDGGPAGLRRLMDQGTHDLDLVTRLDAIRLEASGVVGGVDGLASTDESYAEAFRRVGLGTVDDAPEVAAEWIKNSNIRSALVAAFDHWSVCARDSRRRLWILKVVQTADPGPTGWRTRARDPEVLKDQVALKELVRTAPIKDAPVALLLALDLHYSGVEYRAEFLKRIYQEHPDDFWVNHRLGFVMYHLGLPGEAVGFYQAALAIRPGSALVHNNLGRALTTVRRPEEALAHYQRAVALDPTSAAFRLNLATALATQGQLDAAIGELEVGLGYNPHSAMLHTALGLCLENKGRHAEAFARYTRAIALEPLRTHSQKALRGFLLGRGRMDDMRVAWQAALAANPPDHDAWYGYAELCLFLGHVDEYHHVRKALLDKFGTTKDPQIAERVGRACLLLPAEGNELRRAGALADLAATADSVKDQGLFPYFQFVKGLADYRQGRYEQAIKVLQGAPSRLPGPSPLLVLAMALHRNGQTEEARKTLAVALQKPAWRVKQIRDQDDCIMHVLRREAESLILPASP
jgi:eukaryotic-like serine/threonine-protein kinase